MLTGGVVVLLTFDSGGVSVLTGGGAGGSLQAAAAAPRGRQEHGPGVRDAGEKRKQESVALQRQGWLQRMYTGSLLHIKITSRL